MLCAIYVVLLGSLDCFFSFAEFDSAYAAALVSQSVIFATLSFLGRSVLSHRTVTRDCPARSYR